MDDIDKLYRNFKKSQEAEEKEKFRYCVSRLRDHVDNNLDHLTEVLNRNYQEQNPDYEWRLTLLKSVGYRVFRNSEGNHLIKK